MTDAPSRRPDTCACDGLSDLYCHACWQRGFETAAEDTEQSSETGQATLTEVVA